MPAPLAASGPDPSLTPCPHWCVLAIVDVDVGAADDNDGGVDNVSFCLNLEHDRFASK